MSRQTDEMKPLLLSLADAIECDLTQHANERFTGGRKAILELFEGYSPDVVSSITNSLSDGTNHVVAADQHIFGNVGAVTVVEGQQSSIHVFVYDRSKRPDDGSEPWEKFGRTWSRRQLYKWLEPSTKAIYYRDLWQEDWKKLPDGKQRLSSYNYNRERDFGASVAYSEMWTGGFKP